MAARDEDDMNEIASPCKSGTHSQVNTKFYIKIIREIYCRSKNRKFNFGIRFDFVYYAQIIYAWARDAPKLELPEGVGFKVGKSAPIQYLVLQVHYAHIHKFRGNSNETVFVLFSGDKYFEEKKNNQKFVISDGSTDDSGIFLHYTKQM